LRSAVAKGLFSAAVILLTDGTVSFDQMKSRLLDRGVSYILGGKRI
jgi:hypothetical protein